MVRVYWHDNTREVFLIEMQVEALLQISKRFEVELPSLGTGDITWIIPGGQFLEYLAAKAFFNWVATLRLPLPKDSSIKKYMPIKDGWSITNLIAVYGVMQYLKLKLERFGENPCGAEIWAYLKAHEKDNTEDAANTSLAPTVLSRLWACLPEGAGMRRSIVHCAVEVSYKKKTMAEFEEIFLASGQVDLIMAFRARRQEKQAWAEGNAKKKERTDSGGKDRKKGGGGNGSCAGRCGKTIGRSYMGEVDE